MEIDGKHQRTFKVSRLAFRYLYNSPLGSRLDLDALIDLMALKGWIVLNEDRTRYAETWEFQGRSSQSKVIEALDGLLSRV